jgi:hypothetical protein
MTTSHPNHVAFVTACYRGILDREPDAEGLKHYSSLLCQGTTMVEIMQSFISSKEFRR